MSLRIEIMDPSALDAAKSLLSSACSFDDASAVAAEKLFGMAARDRRAEPLAAYEGEELVGLACTSHQWLRLLAVHPSHRGKGVGAALLARCEAQIRYHAHKVRVLDQPGNYLSPGIDSRNIESISWLERRGYEACASNQNLLIELRDNDKVSAPALAAMVQACREQGYAIERQGAERLAADAAVVAAAFSPGWAFEMRRAAAIGAVHIATNQGGELAAFAAHDGNNQGLGWFGPTGTLAPHRKKGLGAALLMACLVDLADAGHSHCQVAWIGPREFYDRVAGIEGERNFTVLTKELSP